MNINQITPVPDFVYDEDGEPATAAVAVSPTDAAFADVEVPELFCSAGWLVSIYLNSAIRVPDGGSAVAGAQVFVATPRLRDVLLQAGERQQQLLAAGFFDLADGQVGVDVALEPQPLGEVVDGDGNTVQPAGDQASDDQASDAPGAAVPVELSEQD